MKERKLRIEDALAATRAAVEEGIVPGGGVALLAAMKRVQKLVNRRTPATLSTGVQIVLRRHGRAHPPDRRATPASTAASSLRISSRRNKPDYGYDALKGEYVDMIERGIIDPTKVTRSALQNACQRGRDGADHRVPGDRYSPARTGRCPRTPAWAAACINRKPLNKA